jgi:hypothetical protein
MENEVICWGDAAKSDASRDSEYENDVDGDGSATWHTCSS